jgi:hypothetical protein
MLKKFLLISLMCIAVMAIVVPQVDAGCCCSPRWCCGCIPGSLVCRAMATGLGPILKECLETDDPNDCPAGSMTIFGTARQKGKKFTEDFDYCTDFDPNDRDNWPDCSILITVDCENPDPNDPKKPSGVAVPYNYPYPLESGGTLFYCESNGNCKHNEDFTVELPENICKWKWTQLGGWTIDKYFITGDFCKGGWVCPDGSVVAGGGSQCCEPGTVNQTTGRCPSENEVLIGRECCGEPGRDENGDCEVPNQGMINDVEWVSGAPLRIFDVCKYVDPDPDVPDDEFYDCQPCDPIFEGTQNTGFNCPDI